MAEKTKDKVVEYVVKEFERYERHWAGKFGKLKQVYDYWEGKAPKRDSSGGVDSLEPKIG